MHRRLFLSLAALALPTSLAAQPATTPPWRGSGPPRTAEERAERHEWLEQNWESLAPQHRQQAEQRFGRGMMGPQAPDADQMRQRWESMTPNQRRELMFGHHRGRRNESMGPGRMGSGQMGRGQMNQGQMDPGQMGPGGGRPGG